MKRSNRLFILMGVFLSIIAFVGVVVLSAKGGGNGPAATPQVTQVPDVTVVKAATDIPVGTVITQEMVAEETMRPEQKAELGTDVFTKKGEVVGLRAGSEIKSGAYIYKSKDFSAPGTVPRDTDFASSIKAGMRLVSLEIDQVNGVGTLLVPGDHVDVILSVWVNQVTLSDTTVGKWKVSIEGGKDVTTKVVIQNRRIIGTLIPAPQEQQNPNPSATPQPTDDTVHLSTDHMIVLLEVTPQEAEVIRWAQREEKADPQNYITLGLALRSKDDDGAANAATQGVTLRMLVDKWQVLPPDPTAILPKGLAEQFHW